MQQIVSRNAEHAPDAGPTSVMGVDLNLVTMSEALYRLIASVKDSSQKLPVKVGFVNANSINILWNDHELQEAISAFDYVFPDGIGLKLASYLHGEFPIDSISGTALVPALLAAPELTGQRVFLLGDQPTAIKSVAQHFPRLFSTSMLAGYHHGFFKPENSDNVIKLINSSESDILLVGMGTPEQEKWLNRYSSVLDVRIQIAVGGLFQYWDNRLKRAPPGARKLGLEWLCILWQQPFKWRRYLIGNPLFLMRAVQSMLQDTSSIK